MVCGVMEELGGISVLFFPKPQEIQALFFIMKILIRKQIIFKKLFFSDKMFIVLRPRIVS